jgi:hypothetical protein
MTKKDFKERCDFHRYTGGRERHNVIFFDWKVTDEGRGFKFAVAASTENSTKKDLFDAFFEWVTKEIEPSYWVRYKYAETDANRFKVPLALNF